MDILTDEVASMRILASGSTGNAALIHCGNDTVLVDVGISYTKLKAALEETGESFESLSGVLLTHEHIDHIRALPTIQRKHPLLPIYTTQGTAQGCTKRLKGKTLDHRPVRAGRSFSIGSLDILPFALPHDAREPVGFRLEGPSFVLAVLTDLGHPTSEIFAALEACTHLVVEANYCHEMLQFGPYPASLKARIASNTGHLSNVQAREVIEYVLEHSAARSITLGHMSAHNNAPWMAQLDIFDALQDGLQHVDTSVAERTAPSPIHILSEASSTDTAQCIVPS